MSVNRIICIGSRLVQSDAAGPLVFDRLEQLDLPEGVSAIEGGLAGLNLLPLLESGGRVVFVDAVAGFTDHGSLVILDREAVLRETRPSSFGHNAGLPYLLAILPHVCEGELPKEIVIIGLEGVCSDRIINEAARLSIEIAMKGSASARADKACFSLLHDHGAFND